MDKLKIVVITPEGTKLEDTASSVTMKSSDGYFGVRAGALSTVSLLVKSDIKYVKDGKEHLITISGGFAEVKGDVVTIITQ